MPLPKSWTTVTPLSKSIAMILFILLPFIGFFAGMRVQQKIQDSEQYHFLMATPTPTPSPTPIITSPTQAIENKVCTQDAIQCSSGVWVGRTGPNCQFVCPQE